MIGAFQATDLKGFIKSTQGARNGCSPDSLNSENFDFTMTVTNAAPDTASSTDAESFFRNIAAVGDFPSNGWLASYRSGYNDADGYRTVGDAFSVEYWLNNGVFSPTLCRKGVWKIQLDVVSDASVVAAPIYQFYTYRYDGAYLADYQGNSTTETSKFNANQSGSFTAGSTLNLTSCLPFVPMLFLDQTIFFGMTFTQIAMRMRGYVKGSTPIF